VNAISQGLRPEFFFGKTRSIVFCESEGDCTSETGAGQFSIFGASEEKSGRRLPRLGRLKEGMKEAQFGL
jgi:hypothetical protein